MTTARQIKKSLAPLVERHDDLVLKGPWLYLKPVRHLLRAVLIDRTGEAARFRPRWAVMSLCVPQRVFPLNWGAMISRPGTNKLWFWDDPSLQADLLAAIEEQALPRLRMLKTLGDFVAFANDRHRFSLDPFDAFLLPRIVVDVARGDLAAARSGCEEVLSGRTMWSMPGRTVGELCHLVGKNDRAGMARLLHEWEAYTVDKLKLRDIWEPTPFPLETG